LFAIFFGIFLKVKVRLCIKLSQTKTSFKKLHFSALVEEMTDHKMLEIRWNKISADRNRRRVRVGVYDTQEGRSALQLD